MYNSFFTKIAQQLSDAQKEAGNYKKKHVRVLGFEVSIENPAGSTRSGTSRDGKKWSNKIYYDYGYFKGTIGKDKDHLDVFINKGWSEDDPVFIVNQVDPKTKVFDEHKIMVGFKTADEARTAYLKNYDNGWQGVGDIKKMDSTAFKKWAREPKETAKRVVKTTIKSLEKIAQDAFFDELQKIAEEKEGRSYASKTLRSAGGGAVGGAVGTIIPAAVIAATSKGRQALGKEIISSLESGIDNMYNTASRSKSIVDMYKRMIKGIPKHFSHLFKKTPLLGAIGAGATLGTGYGMYKGWRS